MLESTDSISMQKINTKHIELALYMPEIPQNTGTLIRTCASFNATLHIIHPCGFIWSNKFLTRSHMDYIDHANIIHHNTYEEFIKYVELKKQRILATVCHQGHAYNQFQYNQHDIILCGKESTGIPEEISDTLTKITIPTQMNTRSLNLAIAASVVLAHAINDSILLDME